MALAYTVATVDNVLERENFSKGLFMNKTGVLETGALKRMNPPFSINLMLLFFSLGCLFFIVVKYIYNLNFTILTIVSGQCSDIKYIHGVVQPLPHPSPELFLRGFFLKFLFIDFREREGGEEGEERERVVPLIYAFIGCF